MPSAEQHSHSGRPDSSVLTAVYAREESIPGTRQRALGWSRGNSKPSGIKVSKIQQYVCNTQVTQLLSCVTLLSEALYLFRQRSLL